MSRRRDSESDYHMRRQVDSRVFHDDGRADIDEEDFDSLSSELAEAEEAIAYYLQMKKEAENKKQRCEDRLQYLLKQQRLKSYTSDAFKARIIRSTFVHEIDKFLLPERYRVDLGFRTNKAKIHAECRKLNKPPSGVEFRQRDKISVTKIGTTNDTNGSIRMDDQVNDITEV